MILFQLEQLHPDMNPHKPELHTRFVQVNVLDRTQFSIFTLQVTTNQRILHTQISVERHHQYRHHSAFF